MITDNILNKIPIMTSVSSIRHIAKGYSADEKYVLDEKYLLRVIPSDSTDRRLGEFQTIQQLEKYSQKIPEAVQYGKIEGEDYDYMILSFLPGEDGEKLLPLMSEVDQYQAGVDAGVELKLLHQLKAPESYPSWYDVKKAKNDRYFEELKQLKINLELVEVIGTYIRENEHLMYDRPNCLQHDDIHPSNILINDHKFSGIIDFQRMDWGDPIHDLHKLGFFSKHVSIPFTKGIVDGYAADRDSLFWSLYTLYSAMHLVSALVWANRWSKEQLEKMLILSEEVIQDHDNFTKLIPKWYVN
ncbi:Predicted kinase, aminoglycoside phosphotransferase (APT) family [Gracilibacillus ureilyticus]|uniref:Predicted kinase, aminoglycoside phosphotransferase (APT) family n=1 Tax=Gracilibacillus ureilyticus TaxID=531814 RepID=A0A1H9RRN2_9BACI|nr:aminoglycoside phosphotransferase family protein [Gracilibacillus ureilyticus]SER75621.1 Predicted kinase, aminoglycoside phosphotransferase (APT) family [Gracilibacillus ureilyticus]